MQILSGRRHRVGWLAFSHCGRWVAAGGRGLHIWDTANPTAEPQQPPVPGVYKWTDNLAFRPDGRLCFQANRERWFLHNPARPTGKLVSLGRHRCGFVLSPDGSRVVRVEEFTPLRSWVFSRDNLVPDSTVRAEGAYFRCAAFSPDGATLATADYYPGQPDREPQLTLRAADTLKPIRATPAAYRDPAQVLFSPDGSKLIVRSAASFACWRVAELDKRPRKAANPGRKHFLSMACHPDGRILTVDNDRVVRVWDLAMMTAVRAIEWNVGKLYTVAVSPDGTRAATGSHTGKVLVWDWD